MLSKQCPDSQTCSNIGVSVLLFARTRERGGQDGRRSRELTGRFFLSMPPAPTLAAALCRPLEAMTTHLESSPTCRALCPALLLCSSQASVCRDLRSWWNCCCRVYLNNSLPPSLPCASNPNQGLVDSSLWQASSVRSCMNRVHDLNWPGMRQ